MVFDNSTQRLAWFRLTRWSQGDWLLSLFAELFACTLTLYVALCDVHSVLAVVKPFEEEFAKELVVYGSGLDASTVSDV